MPDDDLRALDEYRRSFAKAYETVVGTIRQRLSLEPTGRPAKSTASIVEKLKRESIRLVQMQDVAGCRIVVGEAVEQDRAVAELREVFQGAVIVDRRAKPSYGYRAVHVMVQIDDKHVEIQIRTGLQHLWAELSEKLSDVFDPAIKYGGGDKSVTQTLERASKVIAALEAQELELANLRGRLARIPQGEERVSIEREIAEREASMKEDRRGMSESLYWSIQQVAAKRGKAE
jgi:putative GTP pyrophosphokinase